MAEQAEYKPTPGEALAHLIKRTQVRDSTSLMQLLMVILEQHAEVLLTEATPEEGEQIMDALLEAAVAAKIPGRRIDKLTHKLWPLIEAKQKKK